MECSQATFNQQINDVVRHDGGIFMNTDQRRGQRWTTSVVAAALLVLWSTAAFASTPNEVVEQRTEAVATVLAQPDSPERTDQLATVIDESLDFAFLAQLALGEHWEKRSAEEHDRFMELLRTLLQANYEDRLAGHELDDDYTVDFEEARVRRDRAFVEARVVHDERTEDIVYRLYQSDEQWRIYDLIVDDISLEETYRDGYVPIIEEHGWQELIDRMERRVEALESDGEDEAESDKGEAESDEGESEE